MTLSQHWSGAQGWGKCWEKANVSWGKLSIPHFPLLHSSNGLISRARWPERTVSTGTSRDCSSSLKWQRESWYVVTGSGEPACLLSNLVPSSEFKLPFVQLNMRTCVVVAKISFVWKALGNVAGAGGLSPRTDISNAQTQGSAAETRHGPTFIGNLGICHSVCQCSWRTWEENVIWGRRKHQPAQGK